MKRADLINIEAHIAKGRKSRKDVIAIMRGEDVD
jgi:hypothetical protein